MGSVKVRSGSEWKSIKPKKWNGSNWVGVNVYRWDGSKWVCMTCDASVTSFTSAWSQTYSSTHNNGKRSLYERGNGLFQGNSGLSYDVWGLNKSLCGFGDIKSSLQGKTIKKVELYLKAKHFWYNSGGTIVIGYHNHSSMPNTFSHSKAGVKKVKFTSRTQGQWITLPNEFGEGIRDGKYKGISLFVDSNDRNYYGEIAGAYASETSHRPKLKITAE